MANSSAFETATSAVSQTSIDSNIPNHHVKAFSSNIMHLAQQKYSRLRKTARIEQVNGEAKRLERYGAGDALSKDEYNQNVVYSTSEQSSRWITPTTEFRAELVDHFSKLRLIYSPEAELTKSFAMTMGREIDYKVIAGLVNDAQSGKDGSTVVAVTDASKKVVQQTYSAVSGDTGDLSFEALLKAREFFMENESVMDGENIICVCTAKDIVNLLNDPKLTSSDYMQVKALVNGDINSALGFEFIRTELINNSTKIPNLITTGATVYEPTDGSVGAGAGSLQAGARKVLFYTPRRAVALGITEDVKTRLDVIPEMFHSIQVLSTLDMGAVRMDEKEYLEVYIGLETV